MSIVQAEGQDLLQWPASAVSLGYGCPVKGIPTPRYFFAHSDTCWAYLAPWSFPNEEPFISTPGGDVSDVCRAMLCRLANVRNPIQMG